MTALSEKPSSQDRRHRPTGLAAIGSFAARNAKAVLVLAALLAVSGVVFGSSALDLLSGGGYTAAHSESARTQEELTDRFENGSANLLIVAEPVDGGVDDPANAAEAAELRQRMLDSGRVDWVRSAWTTPDPALRSADQGAGLFLVRLTGEEDQAQRAAGDLVPEWVGQTPGLRLMATGEAQVNHEVNEQSQRDLVMAELIGAPVVGLLLLLVFRTPVAALLPLVVGGVAVALTTAVLALLVSVTDVSLFALNITTALGFGLAVDYSLFVVTRFREEAAKGVPLQDAIVTSTRLAGRTVLFSALTVAVSIAALLLFPLYFLKSIAYAAIPVVLIGAAASIVVLPALLALLGKHIDRWDLLSRFVGPPRVDSPRWRRLAERVMRRPLLFGLPVVALLVLLAVPFTQAQFGLTDHRVMGADAPAYQAAERLRADFPDADRPTVQVLVSGAAAADLGDYARTLSERPDVVAVASPDAVYARGVPVGPGDPERVEGDRTWLTVVADGERYGEAAQGLVGDIRSSPAPGALSVGGDSAVMVDTQRELGDRMPLAIGFIILATMVLLFLFTGSVIIPIKAILMNLLSLTASFGAAVFIFQEGNLRWLVGDFTATGFLEITVPVLMFCIAFGLSMDYEVFLLSRIREQYLHSGDNADAVASGLSHTGRLITAAAAVVGAVLIVLATSELSILKLLGVGLAIAVAVDAVLVRGVLVPAFMKLMGSANWWAPAPLRRLHDRIGLRE